jgi:hypothetical protein
LDPVNAKAFFHRGCLLSRVDPKRALRDFSVSLLLDDTAANINCFLHRGKLYVSQGQYVEALPDLEQVGKLVEFQKKKVVGDFSNRFYFSFLQVLVLNTTLLGTRTNLIYAVAANCQLGLIHMHHFCNLGAAIRYLFVFVFVFNSLSF